MICPTSHLIVRLGNEQYVAGTLRFNYNEFSYFFTYPIDTPNRHLNHGDGQLTSRLDHITFHTEKVHIRHLDRRDKPIEVIPYSTGKLVSNPADIQPLYVESIYFNKTPSLPLLSNFTPWHNSRLEEITLLPGRTGFSILLMLAPRVISTKNILNGLQFEKIPNGFSRAPRLADLLDVDHKPPIRISVWQEYDIIVIATPYVCKILSDIPLKGAFRSINYKNVPAALTDLMSQACLQHREI